LPSAFGLHPRGFGNDLRHKNSLVHPSTTAMTTSADIIADWTSVAPNNQIGRTNGTALQTATIKAIPAKRPNRLPFA
jgi:hypothetical protein